jgi:hypothetical protein
MIMKTEETKGKREGKCCDFGGVFENFKAMRKTMSACCSGQDGSKDSAAMKEAMKKMEACCGPKTDRRTDCSK